MKRRREGGRGGGFLQGFLRLLGGIGIIILLFYLYLMLTR